MDNLQQQPRKNRRRSDRIEAPELFVSVKRKRWLIFEEYLDVETMDVNRGGVGIISGDLKLKLLEKVRLHLDYDAEEYFISGVVVYVQEREGLEFYGIMFTQLPHQFEELLDTLLERSAEESIEIVDEVDMASYQKTQKISIADIIKSRQILRAKRIGQAAILKAQNNTRNIKAISDSSLEDLESVSEVLNKSQTVPDTQRRVDVRYNARLLTVRARSRGLASFVDFITTEASDVSLGGLSLSTPATDPRLGEKIRLELRYKDMVLRASGLITYYSPKGDQHQYGIQFTMVPVKLKSLIKILAANSDKNSQVAVK
ncbi:MAG: PilZ domain-containing protein [Gammaproteobacteria bacterium]|nr:PilZ domain-containing protein [Gammaproteobacteria bacterium]